MQIYNEQLRDLLLPDAVPAHERGAVTIREDAKGRILLTGLHQVAIHSIDDLLHALNFGSTIRQTDSTAINAKSSRSHAVFTLNLIQRKPRAAAPDAANGPAAARDKRMSMPVEPLGGAESGGNGGGWVTVDSKLHFVDLAGSERLKNTGASGERAKEGISINAGLASLGKVIAQLSSRQAGAHVSYRDSRLTRLLQDSLGGSAITYMLACVTPAEFHLSETLNTVQYAQRARAIQSRPKIQQVADDGDKQALIERLRAEISFLRDQIANADRHGDHRSGAGGHDRGERSNEREMELQHALLDVQENYTALSQRHAKLISEITRARDQPGADKKHPSSSLAGGAAESAAARIQRSASFEDAVEAMVLEYEETIRSLEGSLSTTRASLGATESALLEKETKCAYAETLHAQLQARLQKLLDRETRTEQYLHELEARANGRAAGEERGAAVLAESRKEIARLREGEGAAEEYIATLEERLAEADQDAELMRRELARLEHVVERQRSVGKLDSLLYELDRVAPEGEGAAPERRPATKDRGRSASEAFKTAIDTPIPESDEEELEAAKFGHPPIETDAVPAAATPAPGDRSIQAKTDGPEDHAAQASFMQEKLATVNHELFALRLEHEAQATDHELLQAKYDEALRTLAALQEAVDHGDGDGDGTDAGADPARAPRSPAAFLAEAARHPARDANAPAPPASAARSLDAELSSAGELPAIAEPTEADDEADAQASASPDTHATPNPYANPDANASASDASSTATASATSAATAASTAETVRTSRTSRDLARDVEALKQAHGQKEADLERLQGEHDALRERHQDAMDLVAELKAEVHKARLAPSPQSPTFLRRKSSQNHLATTDRAHRALAALGNIAAENLADRPDVKEGFELQLTAVLHELHQRSERVQALEGEIAATRREMETKMTIIAGLTRERSSLKATSPVDMSVVATMRDELLQREHQLAQLGETARAREQELAAEMAALKRAAQPMPGTLPETPMDGAADKELGADAGGDLQRQAHDATQGGEARLLHTSNELEATLTSVDAVRQAKAAELDALAHSTAAAAAAFETERERHAAALASRDRAIDGQRATVDAQVLRIAELESLHRAARDEIAARDAFRTETQTSLDGHRAQIATLEAEMARHQAAVEFHKHSLKSLHDSQAEKLDEVRAATLREAAADAQAGLQELRDAHAQELQQHQEKHQTLEKELQHKATMLDETTRKLEANGLVITDLERQTARHSRSASDASDELQAARAKLQSLEAAQAQAEAQRATAERRVAELADAKASLDRELVDLREKEQRASRLVEELEGQLSSTFEDSRHATSRLSLMQSAREQELADARAATARAHDETAALRARVEQLETAGGGQASPRGRASPEADRTSSLPGPLRVKTPVSTLPSPPPAIPLPPLPAGAPANTNTNTNTSPPASSPRDSASALPAPSQAAIAAANKRLEEQEARIRTIEKHLVAEKQLTSTLEEALVDLEAQVTRYKDEADTWQRAARDHERELGGLRKERTQNRHSLQAVEEERNARMEAEAARAHLEERMAALNRKKKKKSALNCF